MSNGSGNVVSDDVIVASATGINVGDAVLVSNTNGIRITVVVEWPRGTNIPTDKSHNLNLQIHFV